MRRDPLVLLPVALLLGLLVAVLPALAANQTVAVSSDEFTPAAVTISQGETVTWNNTGGSHNVNFDDGLFDEPASPSTSAWTVNRTFNSPGTFRYVCEQHEDDGMVGTVTVTAAQTGTTTTPPPGGGGGPPPNTPGSDTIAPVISRFAMIRGARFRVGKAPTPRASRRRAKAGSAFGFWLSEPADVRIEISRVLKRRGRTRYVTKGTLARDDQRRRSNKVPFSGRIGRRALSVGLYRATITATDEAGNRSPPKRASFRIVSG